MGRPLLRGIVGVAVAFLLACPASAQWQWKDESGRVVFSDRPPPPGVPEDQILRRPAPAPVSAAPAPRAAPAAAAGGATADKPALTPPATDEELQERRRKEEQEEAARQKAQAEALARPRAESCARARSYQQTLDSGVRIARVAADGSREVLDDKARAEEAARTRRIIESDCR